MRLAYGTYAMPTVPLEEAIPLLKGIGYDGVELCISSERFHTLPDQIDAARRKRLRTLLRENDLGIPALMVIRRKALARDDAEHRQNLEQIQKAAELARDLGAGDVPVISMAFGGKTDLWDAQRDELVSRLRDYAQLAAEEDLVLAGEAHRGAAVDCTERALWVVRSVGDSRVRLHFDIVHFFMAGEAIEDSVRALVPITAHTHVTDARRRADGGFDLCLPGEGDLDLITYVKAMHESGWSDFITLEVSGSVWSKEGYDPVAAATSCYGSLSKAFREAGVHRS